MCRYCQMASVWEERFKEEAEKTIPLQEVRIGIFLNYLEKFGVFYALGYSVYHKVINFRSALPWGRIWSCSTRRGWNRSTSRWTRFRIGQRGPQGRYKAVKEKSKRCLCWNVVDFDDIASKRKTTKSWQSELSTRLRVFTRGWNTPGRELSLKRG